MAWRKGFFPTYTWVGILGLALAATVVMRTFTTALPADGLIGFTWIQLYWVASVAAAVLAVSFLIAGSNYGLGFFLSLLAAIGMVVGTALYAKESFEAAPAERSAG